MTTANLAASADRHAWRGYVSAETVIGATINAFMSVVATWLFFHGHARVPSTGAFSLVTDAIPQSFMVALMSVLPVSLLIRLRARKGRRLPLPPPAAWSGPKTLLFRAMLVAAFAAAIGFASFRLLAPSLAPDGVTFAYALILKAAYGAILSVIIVPFAAIAALKDAADHRHPLVAPGCDLIQGLPAADVLADKAYDANRPHDLILEQGGTPASHPNATTTQVSQPRRVADTGHFRDGLESDAYPGSGVAMS